MRSRAWATWLLFTICALAVIEGLGWVTWKELALEGAERGARAQAAFQEQIRLALWRMESEVAPILAQEAARPYFQYQSFYPAERAYTRMLQEVSPGEVMVPSPLLDASGPYVRVHYQIGADGTITSPQVPTGSLRALAEPQYIDAAFLVLATERVSELTEMVRRSAPPPPALRDLAKDSSGGLQSQNVRSELPLAPKQIISPPAEEAKTSTTPIEASTQRQISEKEFQARQNLANSANSFPETRRSRLEQDGLTDKKTQRNGQEAAAAPQTAPVVPPPPAAAVPLRAAAPLPAAKATVTNKKETPASPDVPADATRTRAAGAADERAQGGGTAEILAGAASPLFSPFVDAATTEASEVELGSFQPLWRQNTRTDAPELFLERSVRIGTTRVVQGIWMDWPALRKRLLLATRDLLPTANLAPVVNAGGAAPTGQMLASFPVMLRPGDAPAPPPEPLVSAAHLTLGVTWLAVLGGVIAIGAVLRTSLELSDRRGRFVSAVTHELRTPLTTFRLYTGMLAGGMVKDDAVRREYLATLEAESGKLAGIVENVLEYAKLGGRPARRDEPIAAAELVAQVVPSLERAAVQCGMQLVVEGEAPRGARVRADPATVERILLNLVDNACKYALAAADRRLHVSVGHLNRRFRGTFLVIAVRDHGPGIPYRERRRVFRAFHRAKRDLGGTQSGLGLGLALSRGLAGELGGDLELGRVATGTEIRLLLPIPDQNT